MESPVRTTSPGMIEELAESPFKFDFFHALRMLEGVYTGFPRIGTSRHPREDPLRFGQNPSLAFAPSTLESFQPASEGEPAKLLVRFFGLFGPNGPMPTHFTQEALAHQHAIVAGRRVDAQTSTEPQGPTGEAPRKHLARPTTDRRAFLDFCDIFHHRLISLFYRAWALNQKTVDFDRAASGTNPQIHHGEDWSGPRFALYIGSCFGLGSESLRDLDEIPDWAKLFFAGRLASQTRNEEGLTAILQKYFEVPTEIEPFSGQWIDLPKDSVCELGISPESGMLGQTIYLGTRFWDCQLKFRIRFGPMKLEDFIRFLPGRRAFRHLRSWIINYLGEEYFWDIRLVLLADEVPQTVLGGGSMLGWTTWIRSEACNTDADDVILTPETYHL